MTDAAQIVRAALHLTLPWPPSLWAYYRPLVTPCKPSKATGFKPYFAKMARTKVGRIYRDLVIETVRAAIGPRSGAIFSTSVRLDVELRAPDRRARDLDNHGGKALQDSLVAAGVLSDDSIIDELVIIRGRNLRPGCATVIITPLTPDVGQQESIETT